MDPKYPIFDPRLYIKVSNGVRTLLVYVDDVLITGSSTKFIACTKNDLKKRFEMTDSAKCAFFLQIELIGNDDGSVTMCQRRYVDDIIKRFGMDDLKDMMCPTDISSRLKPSDAATKVYAPCREAVGALMHLMTATRPDIAYAVGCVSRFTEIPQDEHWMAVKDSSLSTRNEVAWYLFQAGRLIELSRMVRRRLGRGLC